MPKTLNFYIVFLMLAIVASTVVNLYVRRSASVRAKIFFGAAAGAAVVWLLGGWFGVFENFGDAGLAALGVPVVLTLAANVAFGRAPKNAPIAYERVFQTIRDGVLILDRDDVIRDINPAAAKGLAKSPAEIVGMHARTAFGAWRAAVELYDANPQKLGEIEVELFGRTRYLAIDSTPLASAEGHFEGRIVTIRDITDRHQQKLSLEALAFHDPLTRVANRRKFQEEAERALEKSDASGEPLTILYLDLNRFKAVNDTYGHAAGDELLKYVAARIASVLRKPDVLARLGGDEFGVLLHKCDETGVPIVVERLLDNVTRPFRVGENSLVADLSIGAAVYPRDGRDLAELLRYADAEMYRAKQNGGGLAPSSPAVAPAPAEAIHISSAFGDN